MEEAELINNTLFLAQQVGRRPVSRLLPHQEQIGQLFSTINQLHRIISHEGTSTQEPHGSPSIAAPRVQRSRRVSAEGALNAANATAIRLGPLLRQYFACGSEDWFNTIGDPRTSHLQLIQSFQKTTAPDHSEARDRLLLACSCHSLANDFDNYEQRQGSTPKHDALLQRVLSGEDLVVQKHTGHHQDFLAGLQGVRNDKGKFEAGLRLGNKIRLLEACGENAGIGCAVGLLLGYECHKLSRLPYSEIPAFFALLRQKDSSIEPVVQFCNEFNGWWHNVSQRYHSVYGTHSQPWSSTDVAESISANEVVQMDANNVAELQIESSAQKGQDGMDLDPSAFLFHHQLDAMELMAPLDQVNSFMSQAGTDSFGTLEVPLESWMMCTPSLHVAN